jgi:hypothetical protein
MASNPGAISQLSGLFGGSSSGTGTQNTPGSLASSMSSNQYASYPSTPGVAQTSSALPGSNPVPYGNYGANSGAYYAGGGNSPGTNSVHMTPTMDPTLTQQFYNMLSGQVGQGLPGFNQSTVLPSSGQATQAGQLNAPLNITDQQLQQFLNGGQSNIPGANQLTQMAQTGNPIDQTPAWQAMIASQQQNTGVNANNLREQFASGGDLNSSPFGSAMQQFYNQNTMNQNSQLTQATATAQENAQNRMLSAGQGIQSEAGAFGSNMQTLDQNAINQMLQQFEYNLPQNNPMMQYMAQGANMQPGTTQTPTTTQNIASLIGAGAQVAGAAIGTGGISGLNTAKPKIP